MRTSGARPLPAEPKVRLGEKAPRGTTNERRTRAYSKRSRHSGGGTQKIPSARHGGGHAGNLPADRGRALSFGRLAGRAAFDGCSPGIKTGPYLHTSLKGLRFRDLRGLRGNGFLGLVRHVAQRDLDVLGVIAKSLAKNGQSTHVGGLVVHGKAQIEQGFLV